MRISMWSVFLTALVLAGIRCSSDKSDELQGTWQMVSGRYVASTHTVECSSETRLSYKLIAADHFSVVEMYRENPDSAFFAAVGRYTLEDSTYTEIIEGSSNVNMVGVSNVFQSTLSCDRWRIYRETADGILDETWERVKPGM